MKQKHAVKAAPHSQTGFARASLLGILAGIGVAAVGMFGFNTAVTVMDFVKDLRKEGFATTATAHITTSSIRLDTTMVPLPTSFWIDSPTPSGQQTSGHPPLVVTSMMKFPINDPEFVEVRSKPLLAATPTPPPAPPTPEPTPAFDKQTLSKAIRQNLSSVFTGDLPYILLKSGDRLYPGSRLNDQVTLEAITTTGILCSTPVGILKIGSETDSTNELSSSDAPAGKDLLPMNTPNADPTPTESDSAHTSAESNLLRNQVFPANRQNPMSQFFKKLIPASLGGKCILAVLLGIALGLLFQEKSALFEPLGLVLIRATTLLVLPYLIVEIIGVFGGMKRESMMALCKNAGMGILLIIIIGASVLILLPSILPPLPSSPLFNPDLLAMREATSLLDIFLPSNIFAALAAGNFPAVVIFSASIGIVLQRMENRETVLALVDPLRKLFSTILNRVITNITPLGILAITANAIGNAEGSNFQRLLGLVMMYVVAIVVVALVILPGLLISLTRFGYRDIWRTIRDPLLLALSTGSVLITLPVIITNLRGILDLKETSDEEKLAPVEALIPLCLTLFSLGKITTPMFVPFAAWYFDAPMSVTRILAMLPSAIPTAMGRSSVAVLEEIPKAGLPANLVSLFYMNEQWISRCSDVLTLTATATVAFLLYASLTRTIRFRPLVLTGFAVAAAALSFTIGFASNRLLAATLTGNSTSREILLSRSTAVDFPPPTILHDAHPPSPEPASLKSIRDRGGLRAGVRSGSEPYVYRNAKGDLVGYDIDMLRAIASSIGVRLEIVETNFRDLTQWLAEGRIDCAVGGILGTGISFGGSLSATAYDKASYALVVEDKSLAAFQSSLENGSTKPLRIAMASPDSSSSDLRHSVISRLCKKMRPSEISLRPLRARADFISDPGAFDALLTSAEAGSAFAVIHPDYTMLPVFGTSLSADLVIVTAAENHSLQDYLEDWVLNNKDLDLLERLRDYWILFRSR